MLTLAAQTDPATSAIQFAQWIPVLPFAAMVVCGLLGALKRRLPQSEAMAKLPAWVVIAAVGGAFLLSLGVVSKVATGDHPHGHVVHFFQWINIGSFSGDFSFYIDTLTCVMLMVVTGIGTLIAVYAAGYMQGDEGYWRFFAYIGLFIFAMTCLVMADNLLLLYLGWEGVGLASYLLIGFYYRKPSAAAAAKKAFIVNRIGDFGFALGLMLTFYVFGSIHYDEILPAAQWATTGQAEWSSGGVESGLQFTDAAHREAVQQMYLGVRVQQAASPMLVALIPFLLMLGAFGKSAQLPLHVWLPDAMEGPTPVSALIHAATMVTAGVYMIARLLPIFLLSEYALPTVAWVGAITALFAATIALCQYDIKRIWAYSTVSQLGYMFLGVGAAGLLVREAQPSVIVNGAYGAVFHLFTHAFFKALLFLTAGSVMHAMAGQLDLRKMSGLRHKMPVTCWLMFIGCLALAGVPGTSGWFSKDTILADAIMRYPLLGTLGIITALLTAFYTFRLWFRVFMGPEQYEMGREHHGYVVEAGHSSHSHDDHGHHLPHEPHEASWLMNGPLVILAAGAILAGILGAGWMEKMIHASSAQTVVARVAPGGGAEPVYVDAHDAFHTAHLTIGIVSGAGAIAMIGLAYLFHCKRRDLADVCAAKCAGVVTLLNNKYYIDEIYDAVIVRPLRATGYLLWVVVDRLILDGMLIDGLLTALPRWFGALGRTMQRGALQGYALTMGVGMIVILLIWWIAR